MLREIRHTKGIENNCTATTTMPAGQILHWNVNQKLNFQVFSWSVQITGPEDLYILGFASEQSAGLGSMPGYSNSMILNI